MVKLLKSMNARLQVSPLPSQNPVRLEPKGLSIGELQLLFVRELYGRQQGKVDM